MTNRRSTLGLAEAYISRCNDGDGYWLNYLNSGSFLLGERWYKHPQDARAFCRERGIDVVFDDSRGD